MLRKNLFLLFLVGAFLFQTEPVDAQIVVDVDDNGVVDFGDIDRWNVINRWMLCELFPVAACVPELDLDFNGIVCFGDRDLIITRIPVPGGLGTLYGDANLDGVVNASDLNEVGANWQQEGGWRDGDFNGDGIVNAPDLNIIGLNWMKTRGNIGLDPGRCHCPNCHVGGGGDQ